MVAAEVNRPIIICQCWTRAGLARTGTCGHNYLAIIFFIAIFAFELRCGTILSALDKSFFQS